MFHISGAGPSFRSWQNARATGGGVEDRHRRQHEAVIFPLRGKSGTATQEAIAKLNNLLFLQLEELKAILALKSQIQV